MREINGFKINAAKKMFVSLRRKWASLDKLNSESIASNEAFTAFHTAGKMLVALGFTDAEIDQWIEESTKK